MNDTGNLSLVDTDLVLDSQDFSQLQFNLDTNDLDFLQLNCLTPPYNGHPNQQTHNYPQSMYSPSSLSDRSSQISSAASATNKRKYTSDSSILSDDLDGTSKKNSSESTKNERKITFSKFKVEEWVPTYDDKLHPIERLEFMIEADKGFAYSSFDDAFICQKKNHFQITTHTYVNKAPKYFKLSNQFFEISTFKLNLYGIKQESQMQQIPIKESDKDRKLFDYKPYECELNANQMNKCTIRRLHFSQTTNNNNRKKNKSNPDQRYFLLVVEMQIIDTYGQVHKLYSAISERLIVRAVNPGQYNSHNNNSINNTNQNPNNSQEIIVEDDEKPDKSQVQWTCSIDANEEHKTCFYGNVGINTSNPDQALSINGNIRLNGFLLQPSDKRIKTNIIPKDTSESLDKIRNLKLYSYDHVPEFYDITGIKSDTGVLAQELQQVIPEAVKEAGHLKLSNENQIDNFLNVDKSRVFMECVGAVQELDKKTDDLDIRIDKLEKVVDEMDEAYTIDETSSQRNFISSRRNFRIGPIDCSWLVNKDEFKRNLSSILVGFGLVSFVICVAVVLTIQMLHLRKQNEEDLRNILDLYNNSKNDSFIYPKIIPPALVPTFCQRHPDQCKVSCCGDHRKPRPRPPPPPPRTLEITTKSNKISTTSSYDYYDNLDSLSKISNDCLIIANFTFLSKVPYPIARVRVTSFDIDVTLTENYKCNTPYCEEINGKFIYYVPLSHFIEIDAPLNLIFDIKYGYTLKNCEMKHGDVLCQQTPERLPLTTNATDSTARLLDLTTHVVKTPAAYFLHSDLVFRIAFENESNDICSNNSQDKESISKNFYREVIFRIFRICGN